MNRLTIGVLAAAAAGVTVASVVLVTSGRLPNVAMELQSTGLKSLKVNKVEFIDNGDFKVNQVLLRRRDGQTYAGDTVGQAEFDAASRQVSDTFPWGKVQLTYTTAGNRLEIAITTTNTSDSDTIQGVWYQPLSLRFPDKVKEYDGSIPLLAHNLGEPAVTLVSYSTGTLAVVSEDIEKPVIVGFPWALDRPKNTVFPLSVNTDRVNSYPDSLPVINRAIPPRGTDTYTVTLRFGRAEMSEAKLAGDIYKKFAAVFPAQLHWTDHRPIGAIFIATPPQGWRGNPRGWFGDAHANFVTPAGQASFRQRLLNTADEAIRIMREMNAQGAITWDLEGEQAGYLGDPRALKTVAPEMEEVADEYFDRFRRAGLRTGLTVRPQELRVINSTPALSQAADTAQLLIDKIAYAKKRWGVSLIYIHSNVDPGKGTNALDASIVQKVAASFPDCLLIPEHSNLRYYAYSVPFKELSRGMESTPDLVRDVYPNAFSLIYTADGALDLYHKDLVAAVKHGDVLMYRTWYADPQNQKVKSFYAQ